MGSRQADPSGPSLLNSVGNLTLDDVVELCRKKSTEIYVGYSGGGAALRQASVEELRAIRWPSPLANTRVADPENWIPGKWFLPIVDAKLQVSN